jgi:carbon-monoxide dehydrogenase medium subunit
MFDYHAPDSLDEALDLLRRLGPDAKILAGGASLIPLMKLRLAEPAHLIDLGRVPGLSGIAPVDGMIVVGAMVRESELAASSLARAVPLIADACAVIADPLVRNVGTLGGNIAHGDPANDHPAAMLALDAVVVARRVAATREIPIAEFHRGLFDTALEPDEILTEVRIPTLPGGTGSAYVKFERQVGDFAMAAAAAVLEIAGDRVERARVAFTNLAPTAVRATSIERQLEGQIATDATIAEAVGSLTDEIAPWDDLRASAEIKRTMARNAAERALRRARERAQARAV